MYLVAFWDLRTEARTGEATIGPIPWSSAMEYGRDFLGFGPEWLRPFWQIIKRLDRTYRDWQRAEFSRHSAIGRKNARGAARGRTRARRGVGGGADEGEAEA